MEEKEARLHSEYTKRLQEETKSFEKREQVLKQAKIEAVISLSESNLEKERLKTEIETQKRQIELLNFKVSQLSQEQFLRMAKQQTQTQQTQTQTQTQQQQAQAQNFASTQTEPSSLGTNDLKFEFGNAAVRPKVKARRSKQNLSPKKTSKNEEDNQHTQSTDQESVHNSEKMKIPIPLTKENITKEEPQTQTQKEEQQTPTQTVEKQTPSFPSQISSTNNNNHNNNNAPIFTETNTNTQKTEINYVHAVQFAKILQEKEKGTVAFNVGKYKEAEEIYSLTISLQLTLLNSKLDEISKVSAVFVCMCVLLVFNLIFVFAYYYLLYYYYV
jgi:hypothetical protein